MTFILTTSIGKMFGEGAIDGIRGIPAMGFFRIVIDLKLFMQGADDSGRLTALSGELALGGRALGRLHHTSPELGIRIAAASVAERPVSERRRECPQRSDVAHITYRWVQVPIPPSATSL